MKLGDRIKTERERLGLTQEELAHKIGYASRSSVQKIETCRTLPMNKIVAVAKALGVSPSYLVGWEEEERIYDEIQDIIIAYQNASEDTRKAVCAILGVKKDTDSDLSKVAN